MCDDIETENIVLNWEETNCSRGSATLFESRGRPIPIANDESFIKEWRSRSGSCVPGRAWDAGGRGLHVLMIPSHPQSRLTESHILLISVESRIDRARRDLDIQSTFEKLI